MKRSFALALALMLVLSMVTFVHADENLSGMYTDGKLGAFLTIKGEVTYDAENFCYVTDTSAVFQLLKCAEELFIGGDEKSGDTYFGYRNAETIEEDWDRSVVRADIKQGSRYDNADRYALNGGSEEIKYLAAGSSFQITTSGVYLIYYVPTFSTADERLSYLAQFENPMHAFSPENIFVEVRDGAGNEQPEFEEEIDADFAENSPWLFNGLFDITNVHYLEEKEMNWGYATTNDRIAYCAMGTEIYALQELSNFVLTKLVLSDGIWERKEDSVVLVEENGKLYPEYESESLRPVGDFTFTDEGFTQVKTGTKYVIQEPGYYEIWAERYDGLYDGITLYVDQTTANYTDSKVLVNGMEVKFEAYNINDNNYFKLRDIAMAISGTEKQFAVGWDAAAACVSITSGMPYIPVGGELVPGDGVNKIAEPGTKNITINGAKPQRTLRAYMINGNNYFKLRDLGDVMGFVVDWDEARNTVIINSK